MLIPPVLALGAILASLYALLFHLFWGRRMRELLSYWLAALLGFGVGQLLGWLLGMRFLMIGDLHLLEGSAVSWASLVIAKRLKL
jgi:hypothetical protein